MNAYDEILKKNILRQYIKEHKRAPSRTHLIRMVADAKRDLYPNLERVGFSTYDFSAPRRKQISSASEENKRRSALQADLAAINKNIESLATLLEDGYRALSMASNNCRTVSSSAMAKVNNLLIRANKENAFVSAVEETFETHEMVDLENSTATVRNGAATLRQLRKTSEDLKRSSWEVLPLGRAISSAGQLDPINSLISEDGDIWEYRITTGNPYSPAGVSLTASFEEQNGITIGELLLTSVLVEGNSIANLRVRVSQDGATYTDVVAGKTLMHGENIIPINHTSVKKLSIIITKEVADVINSESSGEFLFAFDSIEISRTDFATNENVSELESTLYLGPYTVKDYLGAAVGFSYASIADSTCIIEPPGTSVSLYISKDNINWLPLPRREKETATVQFGPTRFSDAIRNVSNYEPGMLITEDMVEDVRISDDEAVLTTGIKSEYKDRLVAQNTVVRRLLRSSGEDLYGGSNGWIEVSSEDGGSAMRTTLEVDAINGTYLDLGRSSAKLNGRRVTGRIHIPKGFHVFETSTQNWDEAVRTNIATEDELRAEDPLYPYNHKLLIEGYNYLGTFRGDKKYRNNFNNFGFKMRYLSPQAFAGRKYDNDLSVYTIEESSEGLIFKVKIKEGDTSWAREQVEVSPSFRVDNNSDLYVKAVLKTEDRSVTPTIEGFRIRVI